MSDSNQKAPPPSRLVPHRTVRIPDDLWDAAKAKAGAEHQTITSVIKRLLHAYLKEG